MKQYKLIKEYPGSPKLNYITPNTEGWYGIHRCEDYPEFWEKVIEKTYEILRIRHKWSTPSKSPGDLVTHNPNNMSYCYSESCFDIYSVKRLCDGEIFTIGDKVTDSLTNNLTNNSVQIINNFHISKHTIICTANSGTTMPITTISKAKIPLLKTEDGFDIFNKYQRIFLVELKYLSICKEYGKTTVGALLNGWYSKPAEAHSTRWKQFFKIFLTEESAQAYIMYHKPCLSLYDLSTVFKTAKVKYIFDKKKVFNSYADKLYKLAKSKL